jgi:hypothetical protein
MLRIVKKFTPTKLSVAPPCLLLRWREPVILEHPLSNNTIKSKEKKKTALLLPHIF